MSTVRSRLAEQHNRVIGGDPYPAAQSIWPGPLHPDDAALLERIWAGMDQTVDTGPQVDYPWDWRRCPVLPAALQIVHRARPVTSDPWRIVGRLYAYIPRRPLAPDACWPWYGGARTDDGRGRISYNGQTVPVPRVSWTFHYGPLPQGARLRRVPGCFGCCRPDHWSRIR